VKRPNLERAPQPDQEYGDTLPLQPLAGSTARSRVARAVPSPRRAEHLAFSRRRVHLRQIAAAALSRRRTVQHGKGCARADGDGVGGEEEELQGEQRRDAERAFAEQNGNCPRHQRAHSVLGDHQRAKASRRVPAADAADQRELGDRDASSEQ